MLSWFEALAAEHPKVTIKWHIATMYSTWCSLWFLPLYRSIRLGYNVLMMDSDVDVMDNPYNYFKHPPLSDITVFNQVERGSRNPNGGLMYVQNAAPDGPAAFMFAGINTHSVKSYV